MKQALIGIVAGLVLGAAGMWMWTTKHPVTSSKEGEEHEKDKKEHEEGHEAHRPTVVKLTHEGQTNAGVQTILPTNTNVQAELKGYGRVLDPAPLVTALFDLDTARNALAISTKEHARIQALFAQNQNASQQALDTAEAAVKRDQLLLEVARTRLLTSAGPALAARKDLPALAQSLASLHTALVRIDLLPGETWEPAAGARLAPLAASGKQTEAEFVSAAPSADAQAQGLAFLFLLHTNALAPGTALVGYLPTSGSPEKGWQIPRSAVVWHEGAAWVFAQTGDEEFERVPVTLERPWAEGWLVTGDISATNRLVTSGAQSLLSEQLKGLGGEE